MLLSPLCFTKTEEEKNAKSLLVFKNASELVKKYPPTLRCTWGTQRRMREEGDKCLR